MSEVAWDWPEIACVLMWRLAPQGCVITRKDLASIPPDMVLREEREETHLELSWITVDEALRLRSLLSASRSPASVSELQGRWQKFSCVLLWKLARDGLRLTEIDRAAVPSDKVLFAHGHAQDIEYRFVPRAEAMSIAQSERDNEGKMVVEAVQ